MFDINKFKARIKFLCAQNGISQKFVSESTGHGQYFLNDVWQGKRTMSDSDFEKAAEALRTSPDYLKGGTDDPTPIKTSDPLSRFTDDSQRAEIAKKIMSLSTEDLLKLEKILDMILEEK